MMWKRRVLTSQPPPRPASELPPVQLPWLLHVMGGMQSAVVRQVTQSPSSQKGCMGFSAVQCASVRHSEQLKSLQYGVIGVAAQCMSLVHDSQFPSGEQYGLAMSAAQWVSVPHSPQIRVVGWQCGLLPPPSGEQSVSVMQVGSQLLLTQSCPAGQWLASRHS